MQICRLYDNKNRTGQKADPVLVVSGAFKPLYTFLQGADTRLHTIKHPSQILRRSVQRIKKLPETAGFRELLVGVTGFEPAASTSQTSRATNCATPRYFLFSEQESCPAEPSPSCCGRMPPDVQFIISHPGFIVNQIVPENPLEKPVLSPFPLTSSPR